MGDLNNKYIDESYGSLLKTTEDTGLSGNTKTTVQDGNGTDTSLKISTEVVDVNGDLQTSGTTRVQGDGELVNVSGNISQFTNDSGYLDTLPTDLLSIGDNVSELNNNSGYLTAGTLPSNVMKEGENISLLTNDSGYLTSIPANVMREGENVSLLTNDSGYLTSIPNTYLESGDNVSELTNDSGYLTSGTIPSNVMEEGDDVSLLNNDSGFITGVNDGTLQVAGGIALPSTKVGFTDNLGNETGLTLEKGFGVFGFENDTSLTSNAALLFKNNYWDVNNSPFANAGTSGIYMRDQNNATTFQFAQNRFGGVQYYTAGLNQPHIFQSNGSSRIDVNGFGNVNNSNNWLEAYNSNLTSVTLNGSDLEFESRNNGQITSITLPAGGGGPTSRSTIKAPLNGSNDFYRLNVPTVSYAGSNYTLGLNTLKMNPFQGLAAGQELKKVAILVNSGVAGSTVDLGLYKVSSNSENGLYPSELVFTIATGIDTSTTGRKEITGLSFTIPESESELFYVGFLQTAGASGVAVSGPSNTVGVTYFGALNASFQNRAMSFIKSSTSSLPTTISDTEWNTYTLSTTYAFVGFN